MGLKHLLHAGCGSKLNKVPHDFAAYREHRLDINEEVLPDIQASIVAMPMIEHDTYDAVFCSHTLEHLYTHEVVMALREFYRVLKPGGEVWIQVPDLQSIGAKLALDKADHVLYQSGSFGYITPLDMIYGHRGTVGAGNLWMAHKTGFTASVLASALRGAGFVEIKTERAFDSHQFELKATARKGGANASQEPETAVVPELEVRACVGEAASL